MEINFIFLNSKFEQLKILDEYESLIWTDRYNDVGDFEIYSAVTDELLSILELDEEIYLWNTFSEHLMIVESYKIETEFDSGDKLIITGRSAESILDRRIVWDKTSINGSLQDGIEKLVNDAIIAPSNEKRKISNFIFHKSEDPKIVDLKLQDEFQGEDLLSVISGICEENNLGFMVQLIDDSFVMSLYFGTDRSYNQLENPYVVFAPDFDNLAETNYYNSVEKYKNVVIVKQGENGYSEYNPNDISGLIRRETVSSESVSENKTVETIGKDTLKDRKIEIKFDGKIDMSDNYSYGYDFIIGDIVQFRNAYGIEAPCRVVEVIVNKTKDEYNIYPTFESIEEKG